MRLRRKNRQRGGNKITSTNKRKKWSFTSWAKKNSKKHLPKLMIKVGTALNKRYNKNGTKRIGTIQGK